MIVFRPATFSDVEHIHKLLNYYAKEGLMLPRARNAIYENLRDYILAVENNRLLGCGALHLVWDRFAEIRSLAVEPSLQKTGIGRQLVEHLEKEGIERGVTMFFTLTYQPGFLPSAIILKLRRISCRRRYGRNACIVRSIRTAMRLLSSRQQLIMSRRKSNSKI